MDIDIKNIPKTFLDNIIKLRIEKNFKSSEEFYPSDVYIELRNNNPNKYAITWNGNCMDKDGRFECEPMPSSRTGEYLSATRYDSIVEAIECFKKHWILNY